MPPKPKDPGGAMGKPLNIRITDQDLILLDRLVDAEKADVAARSGVAPEYIDVSRASLIRHWIRDHARTRGFLPPLPSAPVQGVLPLVAAPAAPVVAPAAAEDRHEEHVEPAAPVVAPAAPVVAPAAPVVAPAAAEDRHEEHVEPAAPVEPAVPKRRRVKAADPDTLRAELARHLAGGVKPADVAAAIGVDRSTLSHFKNGRRGMADDKMEKLTDYLRKQRE